MTGLYEDQLGTSLHRKLVFFWAISVTFLGAAIKFALDKVCAHKPTLCVFSPNLRTSTHVPWTRHLDVYALI